MVTGRDKPSIEAPFICTDLRLFVTSTRMFVAHCLNQRNTHPRVTAVHSSFLQSNLIETGPYCALIGRI